MLNPGMEVMGMRRNSHLSLSLQKVNFIEYGVQHHPQAPDHT